MREISSLKHVKNNIETERTLKLKISSMTLLSIFLHTGNGEK